ncbi:MAG: hypothetical protein ABR549_04710 [Mycobacteriales bacterium]
MSRRMVRFVTAAFVAGGVAIGFVPVASADGTTTLAPTAAAWYQPNPTCAAASGCVTTGSLPAPPPVDVPLSPYPAGTLHVGYDAGQETARTYLAFPYSGVAGTVTAGTLDVPLDVAQSDGSAQPETAHLQACLVAAPITSTEGSISQPPPVDCDQHAVVSYVEKPAPHLHADLAPLLEGLVRATGVALLPDATKVTPTDAWRVVFSSPTRSDANKIGPPVMVLAVTEVAEDRPDVPVDVPTEAPVAVTPDLSAGSPTIPDTTVPDVTAPQVPPAAQPPVLNQPRTITVGYAYPVVWLLPLAFLVLVPLAAGALTKDLTPTPA